MRAKAKTLTNLVRRRRLGSTGSFDKSAMMLPLLQQPKFLIFVKLQAQQVFTPLNLTTRTVRGLLKRLEAKFPGEIKASSVSNVYQRNRKGLVFHMDDDMMELISTHEVFEVISKESEAEENKVEITLVEVEGAR
jgi:hypothetical protein